MIKKVFVSISVLLMLVVILIFALYTYFTPSEQQLNWLKTNSTHISSENDYRNAIIAISNKVFLEKRIIGLGEATHGTKQMFDINRSITEFLIENLDFRNILIELDSAKASKLDNYVSNNIDLNLIDSLGLRESGRSFIKLIREFNQTHKQKVRIFGIDSQSDSVLFLYNEPNMSNHSIFELFVSQARKKDLQTAMYRDLRMFLKAKSIIKSLPPSEKFIILAHNEHIGRKNMSRLIDSPRMGMLFHNEFDSLYLPIATGFYEGHYYALNRQSEFLEVYQAETATMGSYEWILHSAGIGNVILNIRNDSNYWTECGWLRKSMLFRSVGSFKYSEEFFFSNIADEFDVLIYFEQTTAGLF